MFQDSEQKSKKSKTNNLNDTKKVYKRYVSNNKQKIENNKKKTLEVVEKNNLFKLKSYLIKNGVLD